MKIIINGIPVEATNNILVRLQLEENDSTFIATRNGVSFTIDENTADKIAFQLQTIIEDRSRRYAEKSLTE